MNFRKGIPALVLVALCSTWSFGAVEFKEAELTTVKNLVEHDPGTGAAPAKVNEKIGEKSKVSTSAASMAELTFADSSITRMGSNTQFSFQSKERLVKLEKGTILVHTPPGNGGATVDCGGVTGAVSGTTFMASRDGVGNVMFVLLEGQGGLKVTVGGTSTVIRPGQAASVGADAAQSSSTPSKSDAPGGGFQGESKAAAGDDSSSGAGPAKTPAGPDSSSGPASAGEGPASAKPVEIKVFEVDVKKVVATTPLVTEFKAELPSAGKIEATIEVQQAKVQAGKLEKLEVEVVAVAKENGDFLIGSPKLEPEEIKVVNSKETLAEKRGGDRLDVDTAAGGNSLDVDTAAGPGAGAGTPVAASPAPRAETPAPAPPVATPPPVNPGQIVAVPPPVAPRTVVAVKVNDDSRVFGAPNPSFGFSITSGQLLSGHSLVTEFLTTAGVNSPVAGSPYTVRFSNPRILDADGTDVSSLYNLRTSAGILNVLKASQSVAFDDVASLTFGQPVNLVAGALGGNVSFEVVSGPGTIDSNGRLVANSGTGTLVVRAVTAGDSNYDGASAIQTITLAKAAQVLSLSGLPQGSFGAEYEPGLSGVQVGTANFSVRETDGRAGIFGGKVTLGKIFGASSFTLDVSAAGNDNFLPGSTTRTINIQRNVAAVEAANPIRDLLGEGTKSFFSWTSDALAQGYELELGGGEKVPGGQTIRLTSSYYEADGNFATAKVRRLGVSAVAPEENLTGFVSGNDMPAAEMLALDNYFYFSGKAAGVTDGPSDFFVNAATERTLVPSDHGPSVQLGTTAQSYGLYTAKTWKAGSTPLVSAGGGVEKKIFYGDRVDLTSPGAFWDDLSLWDGSTLPVVDSDQRWANFLSRLSDAPDAAGLVWDDQGGILSGAADIYLSGLRELSLVAGSGGIAMQGATLVADQTSVDLTTTGDLEIKTAKIMGIDAPIAAPGENQKSGQLTLEAGGKVKLGAQTVAGNAPTQTEAKDQQVRLEAVETSAGAPSMAVIRTGDSMELRNVTIRNFDGSKLEKVIRNSDGTTTLHGRVLMSGSAVKDFKIKELVGAAVNADAKIQMMAMDMNGNLAGEMMVEGQLPVATELARKLDASITGLLGEKPVHAASVDLTAKTVNFNNATITAMNAITARANTVIVQNSFMTVVRSSGMINMYVREGMVNMGFGTVRDGYANFAGANTFQFGNVAFNISNQDQLNAAYGTRLFDTQNSAGTQAGAINVLKL